MVCSLLKRMENESLSKAAEIAREAVLADQNNDLVKALSLYKQALSYFVVGIKYIKNDRTKALVEAKAAEYMNRAEELKVAISEQKDAVTVSSSGSSSSSSSSSGSGPEDPESAKLMASLQGTIVREKPNVQWDDVAGLESAKSMLKEAVILPLKFPELFTGNRKPWRGILLYGPPGTGKSFLAKAVATEAGSSCFLSVSSSDLMSKFQGESERLVKALFQLARQSAPSIVFIDEIDSLCSARSSEDNESTRRVKTEFLVQMQGVGNDNNGVLVLGATNLPWEIDSAVRRRFERRIYIPLPELEARARMIKVCCEFL